MPPINDPPPWSVIESLAEFFHDSASFARLRSLITDTTSLTTGQPPLDPRLVALRPQFQQAQPTYDETQEFGDQYQRFCDLATSYLRAVRRNPNASIPSQALRQIRADYQHLFDNVADRLATANMNEAAQARITELERTVTAIPSRPIQSNSQIGEIRQALQANTTTIEDYRDQRDAQSTRAENAERELSSLRDQLTQANQQTAAAEQAQTGLREVLAIAQERIIRLTRERDKAQQDLERNTYQLNQDLEQRQIANLQARVDVLENRLIDRFQRTLEDADQRYRDSGRQIPLTRPDLDPSQYLGREEEILAAAEAALRR